MKPCALVSGQFSVLFVSWLTNALFLRHTHVAWLTAPPLLPLKKRAGLPVTRRHRSCAFDMLLDQMANRASEAGAAGYLVTGFCRKSTHRMDRSEKDDRRCGRHPDVT